MEEEGQVVIRSSTGEEPITQYKVCKLNVVPKEIFVKFRKEVEGYRVGVNLEFHTAPYKEDLARLVIKPLAPNQRWKFTYDPWHREVRLLSKKIPITKFLNFQVGVGHRFQLLATGWKWKLNTYFGGDGISSVRNKTSVRFIPGVNFRFGWKADYVLPEVIGDLGTGEPLFNMNCGQLQASLDKVEAIFSN